MKLTDKQAQILKMWETEAKERFSGARLLDNGHLMVFIIQDRNLTMYALSIKTQRFIYDTEGRLIHCYTPDML